WSEQKLCGRTKRNLSRAGERRDLVGANDEDSSRLLESQAGRIWFISRGHERLGVLLAEDPCAPAQGKQALQSKPGTCGMSALPDLPSLDGRSCPKRPDTLVQLLCRSAHGIASRRSISVAISSRARAGSGMSGTEAMSERIARLPITVFFCS